MKSLLRILLISVVAGVAAARASTLDTIGVTLLRATTTNLNGAGVQVGQPEAGDGAAANWEVNPGAVGQPTSLFTYTSSLGTATTFPNAVGAESGHADSVAANYYGIANGVATNIVHADNYEANYFINHYIGLGLPISERIVNQSFTFGVYDTNDDQLYDNYAAQNNVLFLSGVAGPPIFSPATCYNGIGVGSFSSPGGPTTDGRSKPDIIAPGFAETSYTTPQVAGAGAILMQAGTRGDGGSDTNSATDIRTVKALLLNGAIKPAGWTNSTSSPLDARYGAGVLNVFNSYKQLAGGKRTNFVATTVSTGAAHPPITVTNSISALSGWDFETITSVLHPSALDAVNHYFFNVTNAMGNATFTATITLAWNRPSNPTRIAPKNLDLFFYDAANSNLVMCSTSLVDNVEHIFLPKLAPGRYDVQVWKGGGVGNNGSETYALAWEFFSSSLNTAKSGTNLNLSWPVYPDGFVVESTTNLLSPQIWSTNNIPSPVFTNNQNVIPVNAPNAARFFRLRRP